MHVRAKQVHACERETGCVRAWIGGRVDEEVLIVGRAGSLLEGSYAGPTLAVLGGCIHIHNHAFFVFVSCSSEWMGGVSE